MRRKFEASAAMVAIATTVHAHTIVYVDQSAPAGGDGSDWAHAFATLDDALAELNSGRLPSWGNGSLGFEIRIAQGTYRPRASGIGGAAFSFHPPNTSSGYPLHILGGYGGLRSATPDARDFAATATIVSGEVVYGSAQ